jgi:DNA sulfur modification protein DndE
MSIKSVQLNIEALDQITRLKKSLGINKNNVMCRWALLLSLSETGKITELSLNFETGGRGEIAWDTFGGEHAAMYLAILKIRLKEDGIEPNYDNIRKYLIQHINRCLGYMLGGKNLKSIRDLIALVAIEDTTENGAR